MASRSFRMLPASPAPVRRECDLAAARRNSRPAVRSRGSAPARQKELRREHDAADTAAVGGARPGRGGHGRGGRGADGEDHDRAGRRPGRAADLPRHPQRAVGGAGRRPPLTTADVAAKVSVDPSLVREWLRAQAAGGYLDYDAAHGTFTLPDPVAAALYYGPGGALVDAGATMLSSMGEGFDAFSEAFGTGQGFGWHQRTAEPLARHGRLHQGRAARRADRGRDRRDGRRGGGAGRGRLGRGRRLRVRRADPGHRRAVPRGAGPRRRLPRRLDRPLPRRGGPQRRRQRAVRGRGRGRPAGPGL